MTNEFGRIDADQKLDRYYTPKWPVEVLLSDTDDLHGKKVIGEPCAGQGHICKTLRENGKSVVGGDINPESPYSQVDATNRKQVQQAYSVCTSIVTNPPYSADTGSESEVIKTLLLLDVPVYALLRVTFLEPCLDRTGILADLDRVITIPRVDYETPSKEANSGNPATSCWFIWNEPGTSSLDSGFRHDIINRKQVHELLGQETLFSRTNG